MTAQAASGVVLEQSEIELHNALTTESWVGILGICDLPNKCHDWDVLPTEGG